MRSKVTCSLLSLLLLLTLALPGCKPADASSEPEAEVYMLTKVSAEIVSVYQGETTAITVKVTDKDGSPLKGVAVSAKVSAGTGSLKTTAAESDAGGLASFEWVVGAIGEWGKVTVSASGPPEKKVTSAPVEFMSQVLAPLTYTLAKVNGDGKTTYPGGQVTPVSVKLSDASGKAVANVPIEFEVTTGGGGAFQLYETAVSKFQKTTSAEGTTYCNWNTGPLDGSQTLTVRAKWTSGPKFNCNPVVFTTTTPKALIEGKWYYKIYRNYYTSALNGTQVEELRTSFGSGYLLLGANGQGESVVNGISLPVTYSYGVYGPTVPGANGFNRFSPLAGQTVPDTNPNKFLFATDWRITTINANELVLKNSILGNNLTEWRIELTR